MRPRLLPFELAWTDAAFDAIYPSGTALPHGILPLHPARFFDQLLSEVPLEQHLGLRVALWIVALAPLFVVGKLGTIATLDPEDRERVLAKLLTSPVYAVRGLVMGLKAMAALLYVQSPAIRAAMTVPKLVTLRAHPDSGTRTKVGVTDEATQEGQDHAAE